ncbi:MAG: class II D-tagatose-bisphosphate aldolase, non-catalytic subunit [Candidatus Omnitrophica bacterium]|nr:class II D-tagatose-bisphosphate aldolase, non-catalytic subunit [Candidatus Omnitrophota bacterium]
MLTAKLGIAPLSTEIIEAVFRYSHSREKELMVIVSKNQVDYVRGYVNGWTTREFRKFIEKNKKAHSQSNIKLCRDHCGPGFNGKYDIEDAYRTIEEDIANGFDLIHIDFCHFKGNAREKLVASRKTIEHCLNLNSDIKLEVGSDGNSSSRNTLNSLEEVEEEISFFKTFCDPEFYVVQTGSLVRRGRQAGSFNKELVEEIASFIYREGIKLKEHNADYLSKEEILQRKDLVDAMNIAPQLGTVQTRLVLDKCLQYGVDCNDFLNIVYKGNRWKKWVDGAKSIDRILSAQIAGHYHYTSDEYIRIIDRLNKREDMHEGIIDSIMKVIDHYENCQ